MANCIHKHDDSGEKSQSPWLVATCFCTSCSSNDTALKNTLQHDLTNKLFADNTSNGGTIHSSFDMGGRAGFAFGGITSFGVMTKQIPESNDGDGNCVRTHMQKRGER